MANKPKNEAEVVLDDDVLEGLDEENEKEEVKDSNEDEDEEIELNDTDLAEIEIDEEAEKVAPKATKKPGVRMAEIALKDLVLDSMDRKKEEFAKSDAKMVQLVENIRSRGLINPIVVHEVEDKPGTYRVIAGRRRTFAMRLLKKETINAVIRSCKSEADFVSDAISDNAAHSETDKEKLAATIKDLLTEGTCKTQEEVAKLLGFSQAWVSNLLNFNKIPDELKGELTVSDARDIDDIEEKSVEEIKQEVHGKKYRTMPASYFVDSGNPKDKVPIRVQVSSRNMRLSVEVPLAYMKEGTITKFLSEQMKRVQEDEQAFMIMVRKFRQQEFAVKKDGESKKAAKKAEPATKE